ncbi:MAG: ATP-binding protein [Streptosporangiaceae bacterium]
MPCWSFAVDTRQVSGPSGELGLDHELLRMREWPLGSYLALRALPASVRRARRHATATLREWQLETLADPVEVLTSEIVTNAVHASADAVLQPRKAGQAAQIGFWLTSDRRSVLIQVWDADPRPPIRQDNGLDAETGRGLMLVETLSTQWGCCAPGCPAGKIVWAVCT